MSLPSSMLFVMGRARLGQLAPRGYYICAGCKQSFGTSRPQLAGHNKWSKTKHIKAVTDKKKMSDRTAYTKLIAAYSRMYGEDTQFNPQLANATAAATKASVPKALVEAAIARGQGRSTSGAQLETMTMEILMPPTIALIADIETDNKTRTLHDVKYSVKKAGGVAGSTAFYFSRRGRAVFKKMEGDPTLSDVLDAAIEHEGVEDVEEHSQGGFVVWTEPTALTSITEAVVNKFELELLESDIVWAPKEDTMVELGSDFSAKDLDALLSAIKECPDVKAIYANVRRGNVGADAWDKVERHIDL